MITINNYAQKTASLDFSKQPDYIREAHKDFSDYQEFYNEDKDIKEMLDNHMKFVSQMLNNHIEEELNKPTVKKSAPKATGNRPTKPKTSAAKPKTVKTKAAKPTKAKTTKPKTATKSTCSAKTPKVKVESFAEDERLIRRFHGAVGKERQRRTILNIYRDFERRKTERKVNVNSKYAELVAEITSKLKIAINAMDKSGLTHITIAPSASSKAMFNKVAGIAKAKEIRTSANLLKRFIGIEGENKPDKVKVKRLVSAFDNAFKAGKVCEGDLYFSEVKDAQSAMNNYLEGKTTSIEVTPQTLKGLFGLGKPKATATMNGRGKKSAKTTKSVVKKTTKKRATKKPTQKKETIEYSRFKVDITRQAEPIEVEQKPIICANDKHLGDLFTPITAQASASRHEKIELDGDLGKFLGYVERYEYSILLRGEKGAGKTRMLYQLMNTFARAGFSVGSFTLEIGKESNLVTDMRNQYISPIIANNVFIAESVPKGIDTVREAAKKFDVVCIDSWGKIPGTKPEDFDNLRKEFPKTMFIVIFQSTTNGTARGGSMPEYDAGIVIQVAKGGRAYFEKNRYNGEGGTYLVFKRQLEVEEPEPSMA